MTSRLPHMPLRGRDGMQLRSIRREQNQRIGSALSVRLRARRIAGARAETQNDVVRLTCAR
jgi:hypothetical protein